MIQDYEFYYTFPAEHDDDYLDQSARLCGLELYERVTQQMTYTPDIELIREYNLFYGIDPTDDCFRWQLHYPSAN